MALIKKRYRIVKVKNHYEIQKLHWLFYIIPYWFTCGVGDEDGCSYYPYKYPTVEAAESTIINYNKSKKLEGVIKIVTV